MLLSPEAIERFYDQGFLIVEDFTTADDLARIRRILMNLYAQFDRVPLRHRVDLGTVAHHAGPQQIAEINWALRLAPELELTRTFSRGAAIASQLLGGPAQHTGYDHAILKPPGNACATPWHQDQIYAGAQAPLLSVHFWVPLQDVTVEMGCMQFIPGSHRGPLLPHQRIAPRSHSLEAIGVDVARAVACPLRLGGATIHLPRTLHHTGPNTTDESRLAWGVEFALRQPRRPWLPLLRRPG